MKVFIVDDHLLFRMGTRLALQGKAGIDIVGEAGSGRELFEALNALIPDIILLDISLPDMSGIEIARRIKQSAPEIKILLFSAENPESVINDILDIGIEGFLSKSTLTEDIEFAIKSIMNGGEYFSSDITKVMYDAVVHQKKKKEKEIAFTERELEIIRLCSEGLLSKEIATRLFISSRTVETHKNNIFRKLGINKNVELSNYAIKHGIIK